ncbi:glycosyltransferase family 4 protein [Klebsiella aerogenes]
MKKKLCDFVNSAWYFELHWLERGIAALNNGYDVYVIANFVDDAISNRLTALGFRCVNSQINEKSINPFAFIKGFINASRILKNINPDILHCITIKPGIISCLWAKYHKTKLVYSFVGLGRVFESEQLIFKILRWLVLRLYRYLFSNVDCKIIFEHREDKRKILSLLGVKEEKAKVIDGAGVNISYFSYQQEPKLTHGIILFASRMLHSKGLLDLIKAKRILKLEGIDCTIQVAGIIVENDDDGITLGQIEKWHAAGDIVWLGTRDDIRELIAGANIVALPSVYPEGVPRILLEAGAVGRACVVYDNGGCNSLIKDGYNGYIVERKNVKELAAKIKALINEDADRQKMGINARENIVNHYTSEIVIDKTLKVYEELFQR